MEQNLTPIIKDSFLQFAGAVLQNRALVDVRDCIKPSARQIFYCMYTDGFVSSKPFQKTLQDSIMMVILFIGEKKICLLEKLYTRILFLMKYVFLLIWPRFRTLS